MVQADSFELRFLSCHFQSVHVMKIVVYYQDTFQNIEYNDDGT